MEEYKYQRKDVANRIQYRRLLAAEIFYDGDEREHLPLLEQMTAEGLLRKEPAIHEEKGTLRCARCGSGKHFLGTVSKCGRCGEKCFYCRACLMMGRTTSCGFLYSSASAPVQRPGPGAGSLGWNGELSAGQRQAAEKLLHCFHSGKSREFLLWAVCGAGKTEMLFPLISESLKKGDAVMLCTPRRDVVQELEPRLKQAFPEAETAGFYGGKSPESRFSYADIAVATTHQLLRFYKAYALIIIDEVDAFPYTMDKKLQYAVHQAAADKSMTVYVTATPSRIQQRLASSGSLESAVVSRRFHGGDLPVPRLVWAGNWKKKIENGRLPKALHLFLKEAAGRQVLLFVPAVSWLIPVQKVLKKWQENIRTATVHSQEEKRSERVKMFREGSLDVLITTTILERGITIENVQVAVLGAEDAVFTETALIQIAGRAGRSSLYPTGMVSFFHYGSTREMKRSVRTIVQLNRRNS
ncbi:MAG: DEAD/DEAH box helicase [Alkalicoccus sp.]|nr:MAG: DEAD/DEAH box helicase [Alkalicoccus sp.]